MPEHNSNSWLCFRLGFRTAGIERILYSTLQPLPTLLVPRHARSRNVSVRLERNGVIRQTIGAFVYHDLRKSNDVVIILVQGRWSHRPPLMYPETEQ